MGGLGFRVARERVYGLRLGERGFGVKGFGVKGIRNLGFLAYLPSISVRVGFRSLGLRAAGIKGLRV